MGILNVTPDSFFDGGKFIDSAAAVAHGMKLVEDGAYIIDIGGESTRPGSASVDADEEISRVIPVIKGIRERSDVTISIDTRKAVVAEAAIDAGAEIVNDVSALRYDPDMAELVAKRGAGVVLMHALGDPSVMQDDPRYESVVDDINTFFAERLHYSTMKGIDASNIYIDPGIGFGKTLEHNLEILRRLDEFKCHGVTLLVGPSNKSFIGLILDEPVGRRIEGTIAASVLAVANGADILRVHDVAGIAKAIKVAEAIINRKDPT